MVLLIWMAIPTGSIANGWSNSGTITNSKDYVTLNYSFSNDYNLFDLKSGLSLSDTKGSGLGYGSVNISLSKKIWENELSSLTGNLSHSMDFFFDRGQVSQITSAQLNMLHIINPVTALQLSISHSERNNLQQIRQSTSSLVIGISSKFKNLSYSTSVSLGKSKQGEISDNFDSFDFGISYPVSSQLNIKANYSDGFDHQRRIFGDQAYDIWTEAQKTSVGLNYTLNLKTSLTIKKIWLKNKTEYGGEQFNSKSSDWSVSLTKVF